MERDIIAVLTAEQVTQYLKPRIKDAIKRKHNRVWVGTFTEQDKEYEVFVTVEERK